MKVLVLNPLKCTGCRLCELVCAFEHTGMFNPSDSRIKVVVFPEELTFVPSVCMQCEQPYCAEVCPTSALEKNSENGLVDFNKSRCIGCKQCIIACPWGSIKLNFRGKEVIKCDNCGGDPVCVKVCLPGALRYEAAEDVALVKQKETADKYRHITQQIMKGVSISDD